jgi:hypothetical protein
MGWAIAAITVMYACLEGEMPLCGIVVLLACLLYCFYLWCWCDDDNDDACDRGGTGLHRDSGCPLEGEAVMGSTFEPAWLGSLIVWFRT